MLKTTMEPTVESPLSRHLEIEALSQAVRWPDPDRQTVLTLTGLLMAARRHEQGHALFLEKAQAEPERPLYEALAGFFAARAGHGLDQAVAALDRAAERELGLPNYLRGLALAGRPGFAGRLDTVISDLELVIAVGDQFPPGLLRPVHPALASAYTAAGRDEEARAAARPLMDGGPSLTTDWSVSARDGARFASPRFTQPAPGVHLAQGYDFSDFAFVETGPGIVAIDTSSNKRHAMTGLEMLRTRTTAPITHVILTHAHWDHVGGLEAIASPGVQVIAQGNFAGELALQSSVPVISPYFLAEGESQEQHVTPDRLVTGKETLRAGDVDFVLYPTRGGETADGLLVHPPDRGVVFTGDMIMPYLGAPFLPEGSAEGLFEAMRLVRDLRPRKLIHGHPPLTELFTIEVFSALEAALRDLFAMVVTAIRDGRTLAEILHRNHLPGLLREHPAAVLPYLVIRENLIKRVHHQRTGYWKAGGEGVEHVAPAEWAAALHLLSGGREITYTDTARQILERGNEALALKVADYGLLNHPDSSDLDALRRSILYRLAERHQQLNPFKFVYYAGLAGLEIPPALWRSRLPGQRW
jgi:glyoxylase-like metal-dependent hydrolase (beta-lactamase superfamily II)